MTTTTQNATIVRLPSSRSRVRATPERSPSWRRRVARQRISAWAVGTVGLVLTGLSLSHLAEGVHILTHGAMWHAWAMAVGIDLGFVFMELGQLACTTESLRRTVARYADPAIKGTLIASAAMNAYAFAIQADNVYVLVAACLLGISIPAMIYVLTRVSAAMWLACQR